MIGNLGSSQRHTIGRILSNSLKLIELPFSEDRVFDGFDVLRRHPVDPVPGLLCRPQLQGHYVVLIVAFDGLANDTLD